MANANQSDVLGKFVWYDQMSNDLPGAEKFYSKVVGWDLANDIGYSGFYTKHAFVFSGNYDLPGHGAPFHDKALVTAFQSYLTDIVKQGIELKKQGVSADDAAKRIDLTSHQKDFPAIRQPGADIRGVRRLYAWLDEHPSR